MQQATQQLSQELMTLTGDVEHEMSHQGVIGSTWNFMKNTIGISSQGKSWWNPQRWWAFLCDADAGSHHVKKQLEQKQQQLLQLHQLAQSGQGEAFKQLYQSITGQVYDPNQVSAVINAPSQADKKPEGLLSNSPLKHTIHGFKESQHNGVDIIADLAGGIVSFTAYGIAAASLAAAPFTAGSSLLITAGALGIAAGTGALTKTALKATDAYTGGQSYTSFWYDMATGGFTGALAPLSSAGGTWVSKQLAQRLGVEAVMHNVGKSLAIDFTLNSGSLLQRAGIRTTKMALEGTLIGGIDSPFRHVVKTGSSEGVGEAALMGAVGGALLSPVMGGGMHLAGKAAVKGSQWMGFKGLSGGVSEAAESTVAHNNAPGSRFSPNEAFWPRIEAQHLTRPAAGVKTLADHLETALVALKNGDISKARQLLQNPAALSEAGFKVHIEERTIPLPKKISQARRLLQKAAEHDCYFDPNTNEIRLVKHRFEQPPVGKGQQRIARYIEKSEAYMGLEESLHALQECYGGIPLSKQCLGDMGKHSVDALREYDIAAILHQNNIQPGKQVRADLMNRYQRRAYMNGKLADAPSIFAGDEARVITVNGLPITVRRLKPGTQLTVFRAKTPNSELPEWLRSYRGSFGSIIDPVLASIEDPVVAQRILRQLYQRAQNDPVLREAIDRRFLTMATLFHDDTAFNNALKPEAQNLLELIVARTQGSIKERPDMADPLVAKLFDMAGRDDNLANALRKRLMAMATVANEPTILTGALPESQAMLEQVVGQLEKSLVDQPAKLQEVLHQVRLISERDPVMAQAIQRRLMNTASRVADRDLAGVLQKSSQELLDLLSEKVALATRHDLDNTSVVYQRLLDAADADPRLKTQLQTQLYELAQAANDQQVYRHLDPRTRHFLSDHVRDHSSGTLKPTSDGATVVRGFQQQYQSDPQFRQLVNTHLLEEVATLSKNPSALKDLRANTGDMITALSEQALAKAQAHPAEAEAIISRVFTCAEADPKFREVLDKRLYMLARDVDKKRVLDGLKTESHELLTQLTQKAMTVGVEQPGESRAMVQRLLQLAETDPILARALQGKLMNFVNVIDDPVLFNKLTGPNKALLQTVASEAKQAGLGHLSDTQIIIGKLIQQAEHDPALAKILEGHLYDITQVHANEALVTRLSRESRRLFDHLTDHVRPMIVKDPHESRLILSQLFKQAERDPALLALLQTQALELGCKLPSPEFLAALRPESQELLLMVVQKAGISTGKLCQIIADEESVAPHLRQWMELVKSQNKVTRDVAQTQAFVDGCTWTGESQFKIDSVIGAGTVGETSFANNGTRVVKLFKDGITLEGLDDERIICKAFLEAAHSDNPIRQRRASILTDFLFDGWAQELDYVVEAQGAQDLARGAKRFKVAQATGLAKDNNGRGIAIAYERAEGLSIDRVIKIRQALETDAVGARIKYKKDIATHPWLETPETWLDKLPQAYLDAQNEQVLFINGAFKTSHGDPHLGNVFMTVRDGKPMLTYIDTGLTVTRQSQEVAQQLGSLVDVLTGNWRGVARTIIYNAEALPMNVHGQPVNRPWLTSQLEKRLQERLKPGQGIDLTDLQTVNRVLDLVTEELGIIPNTRDAIFLKSQLQSLLTYEELSRFAGQPDNVILRQSMGDTVTGLCKAFSAEPNATWRGIQYSIYNFGTQPVTALRNLNQFYRFQWLDGTLNFFSRLNPFS